MSATATFLDVIEGRARWCVEEGDALDLLRALPSASIDAIGTDPPYARTAESSVWVTKEKVRSLPIEVQFYEAWIREYLIEFKRTLRPAGAAWFTCDLAAVQAVERACCKIGMRPPLVGVWHREGLGMGHILRHVYEHFVLLVGPEFERTATDEPDLWTCKWTPGDRTTGHSAEKPIPLMARALRLMTKPGAMVLDPWSGSGSTGVASLREGMRYVGFERDDGIAAMQRARLSAEVAGLTLKAANGGQMPLFAAPVKP